MCFEAYYLSTFYYVTVSCVPICGSTSLHSHHTCGLTAGAAAQDRPAPHGKLTVHTHVICSLVKHNRQEQFGVKCLAQGYIDLLTEGN